MKRILITGGAGFLGSHLCDRFIKEGYHVIAMDNLITGDLKNIEHLFKLPNFEFYHHDVSKFIHVPGNLDYILHFASPASPIDYLKIPIQTLKVGSLGIHNCLGLARVKGARVLIASTSEVYGDPTVHPQPEEYWGNVNPVGPRGVYDEAKRFQEAMTMAYHTYHGLETRIVRIFNTYGPRQSARAVIPTIITQLANGIEQIKLGDTTPTRDLVFVKDTAEGFIKIAETDSLIGHEINIATENEISVGNLAQHIINQINPNATILQDTDRLRPQNSEVFRLLGSKEKLVQHTGWFPQTTIEDGLLNTIEWFKNPENLKQYKHEIYNV